VSYTAKYVLLKVMNKPSLAKTTEAAMTLHRHGLKSDKIRDRSVMVALFALLLLGFGPLQARFVQNLFTSFLVGEATLLVLSYRDRNRPPTV
jgi:hypothetical protein